MKSLSILLLAMLLGCASPVNRPSPISGNRFSRYSTPELQSQRQELSDSISNLQLLSGMPLATRERYLADRREDIAAMEAELNQRHARGDMKAALNHYNTSTNTVKSAN